MPYLQLDDKHTLHYHDDQRQGFPIVLLLHGLGVNRESWQLQLPAFQKAGFRILTPDIRGFGKSSYPGGGVSIHDLAGDMFALLQALDIRSVAIAGISMGGTLALQMALDQPVLVSRLALINTFACLRPKQVGSWLYFASRFVLAHLLGVRVQARAVANHLFPGPGDTALRQVFIEQISQANPAGYRAAMRALARFNVSHRLDQISAPTLVITGADDSTVPPATQEFLAKHIHNARHEIIAGAGHAVIVQKPLQINRLLIGFITCDS